jgi:hypothetical protein
MASGPDPADLFAAESILRRAATEIGRLNVPVRAASGREVLSGETLGDSLEDFIDSADVAAVEIGDHLFSLAKRALDLANQALLTQGAGP